MRVAFPTRKRSMWYFFNSTRPRFFLAIRRAGDYDLISRPVVYNDLARFLVSRHDRVQRVPYVLSHDARPERRAVGVTRLGPDGIFLYFDQPP